MSHNVLPQSRKLHSRLSFGLGLIPQLQFHHIRPVGPIILSFSQNVFLTVATFSSVSCPPNVWKGNPLIGMHRNPPLFANKTMNTTTKTLLVITAVLLAITAYVGWNYLKDFNFGGQASSNGPKIRIPDFQPAQLAPFDPQKIEMDKDLKSPVISDQILVTMHAQRTRSNLETILKTVAPNAKIVGAIPAVNMFQVEIAPKLKHSVSKRLDNHPWIASATLNFVRRGLKSFNDPFLSDSVKGWGINRINAPEAWDITTGLKTTIAVVDSGTLTSHEEFDGKVVRPYSYATNSEKIQYKEYYEAQVNGAGQTEYRLDYVAGHGTHVAGTASGNAGNGKGTAGIAPDAYLMPVQVLYFVKTGEYNGKEVGYVSGDTPQIVAGISRAIAKGADVINLSLGPSYAPKVISDYVNGDAATRKRIEQEIFIPRRESDLKSYKQALDLAKKYNVILVNAAGNDNIPAEFDAFCFSDRMISVAATNSKNERASFSNYGSKTTVSAPGVEIHSSFSSSADAYTEMPGTSMACPHVAGVVALMRSVNSDLTFEEAREILIQTGLKLSTDQPIGPLVNASAAVVEAKKRKQNGQQPPAAEPPLVQDPTVPVEPSPFDPTPVPDPVAAPTPAQIVNGPAPWNNQEVQNLIDLWLSLATPTIEPVDGRPWFYDEWARALNNYSAWAVIPPDHGGMSRHQYVWQFAKKLDSTRHGTLYEFVLGMLRTGTFNPAPTQLPSGPQPGMGGNPVVTTPNPTTTTPTNPGPGSSTQPPTTSGYDAENLTGQWIGKNGEGKEMGLTFFDSSSAWSIQEGNPTALRPAFDTSKTPVTLELSGEDGKVRQRFAVEILNNTRIKVSTYFNTSRPRFQENDQRYTYVLDRTSNQPGETDPARYGFNSGNLKLRSSESIIVGSKDKNQIPGEGFVMPEAYRVTKINLSDNGQVAWILIDNVYPATGTQREQQVWHVDVATGKATRSPVSLVESSVNAIRTTPDGQYCWAVVDYSLPAAVQPIREFRVMRATRGQAFRQIADTGDDDSVGRLGLAQDYNSAATTDGRGLFFNDGLTIWHASETGFKKVVVREDVVGASGLKTSGNNGFRDFRVSREGNHWIAMLLLKDDKGSVNTLVSGPTSGGGKVVLSTKNYISKPRLSSDGSVISYFDSSEYETYVGSRGNFQRMTRVGRYHTHSAEFILDGKQCYAVVGSYGSSNQSNGFIENLATGQRQITHGGIMIGPNPGRTEISRDGQTMLSVHGVGLGKILLDGSASTTGGAAVEEVLFRVVGDKLIARAKVIDPEQVADIRITYMHNGHTPSNAEITWEQNPFASWGGLTRMYPNGQHADYYESSTKITLNGNEILPKAQFLIAVKSKDNQVKNYLVNLN